jgi:IS5 family transposase
VNPNYEEIAGLKCYPRAKAIDGPCDVAVIALNARAVPQALARRKAHNARVQRIRCRIETVFGTCKRCHGLRRMRWIGLARAGLQVRLAAIACTLRRTVTLISAAA